MVQIIVNGACREISHDTKLGQLLCDLSIAPEQIAVEVNLAIIDRGQFHQTTLQEGDKVEIIKFVGGGCYAR